MAVVEGVTGMMAAKRAFEGAAVDGATGGVVS